MELVTRTAKLAPHGRRAKAGVGFATAYYHEPDAYDPVELGNLYIVVEALAGKESEEVAELIIQTAANHYYNLERHDSPLDPLQQFEAAIRAINQELAAFTADGNASWVGKLSAVLAVLSDQQLHLTQTGSAEAHLLRRGQATLISSDLGSRESLRPTKTFTNVASGELKAGDRLFFTTPALMHHLSKQEVHEIVRDNNPNLAIQKLSGHLRLDSSVERIAALAVEVSTAELMANRSLPAEPDEVLLGDGPSLVDNLRPAAEPALARLSDWWEQLRQAAAKVAPVVIDLWQQHIQPFITQTGQQIAQFSRQTYAQSRRGSGAAVAKIKQLRQRS